MNSLRVLLRSALFTAALGVVATTASAFEGRITNEMSSPKSKEPQVFVYTIKGPKTKFDLAFKGKDEAESTKPHDKAKTREKSREKSRDKDEAEGNAGMILDSEKMEMIILMDMTERKGGEAKKMFMRKDLRATVEKQNRKAAATKSEPPVKTGRTETIAGYKAEEYTSTSKKGEVTEMWVTKELGGFMMSGGGNPMAGGRGAQVTPEWEEFARDGAMFPLRVVTRAKDGTETMRMETKKVEKMKVDDATFSTDGYEEFVMPNFGDLMKGMNPFAR